jgi:Sensors of blue-light using FAD
MLVRLLYASRAVESIGGELIDEILAESRAQNPEHGITGVLCVCQSGDVFMQALEGGRDEVNRLYGNLLRDRRHHDVMLLDYAEISERRFAGWRMGCVDLNKVNISTVLKYSEKPRLDPFATSGKVALALLEELIDTAAIMGRSEGGGRG